MKLSRVAKYITEFLHWTCRKVAKYIRENFDSEIHNANALPLVHGGKCQPHSEVNLIDLNIKLHESKLIKAIQYQNFL